MRKISPALSLAFGLALVALTPGQPRAATLTTLVDFNGADGQVPVGSLIADDHGNLFGTTQLGGAYGNGTVFEIAKTASGYASTPNTLVNFNGTDGARPTAGLIADAHGNLFGMTFTGGAYGDGTVFEIAKTASGYASMPTTLVSFNGSDGAFPQGDSLIADAQGNLFGMTTEDTPFGFFFGYGTVFEIAKTAAGYASTLATLVSFNNTDGAFPQAGLIADATGNLFGTTVGGGAYGDGTVFEILKTAAGYASTPTVLVSFNGTNGLFPQASLIADANGNLFGTTEGGGVSFPFSYGTVFEIAKTAAGYASAPTILVNFNGANGANPVGNLIADINGNLFGTTLYGGASGDGTVFEITKTAAGYASAPTTLVSFGGTDGAQPFAGLIADANGNLFGTTEFSSGTFGAGTAFEITGSGFVPPAVFAGTPGTPRCLGKSVRGLARQYGGLLHAAAALGYDSVRDLLEAVRTYCEA